MGKISRRPISMKRERNTLLNSDSGEKLASGPTVSNPGPTLDRQPKVAVKEVVRECPSSETTMVPSPYSRK